MGRARTVRTKPTVVTQTAATIHRVSLAAEAFARLYGATPLVYVKGGAWVDTDTNTPFDLSKWTLVLPQTWGLFVRGSLEQLRRVDQTPFEFKLYAEKVQG